MVSYFTCLKTNDAQLLAMLSGALPPEWKLLIAGSDVHLEWGPVPPTRGDQLYVEFMNQYEELRRAAAMVQGRPSLTIELAVPPRFWREEDGCEVDVQVWSTGYGSTLQGGCSTFGIGGVNLSAFTGEELVLQVERERQHAAQARLHHSYRRMLARGYCDHYRQVMDDWERQGTPDVRSLFVYVETMHAYIPTSEFKGNGRHKEFAKDYSAFRGVANNPHHYGIDARHGWGYSQIEDYNPEFAYMTKEIMVVFVRNLMAIWEDHLVVEAEKAKAAAVRP